MSSPAQLSSLGLRFKILDARLKTFEGPGKILDARPNSLERSKFPVLDSYIFSCGFSDDPVHNDSNIPTFEGPQTVHYKTCVL